MSFRVAVVGATGAVGGVMLDVLAERAFPAAAIVPFASPRSAGRELPVGVVQPLDDETIQGFDIALFSAGSTASAEWAPRFAAAGCLVIDNSSQWRMQADVPLVLAEVNPEAIDDHRGIVANPNCSTMQMVVALKPLHDAAGIERLVISTYQSTSGTGVKAVAEMMAQARQVLAGETPAAPAVYPHQIAFNVLPQVETFKNGDDYTTEERKMIAETRKILGLPELRISATCARVPVRIGHSQSVNLETAEDLTPEQARELLRAAPGRQRGRRPGRRRLSDGDRRRGRRRRPRRPHPPRSVEPADAQPVDRRRQPAQGRRAERRPARRARRGPGTPPRRAGRTLTSDV